MEAERAQLIEGHSIQGHSFNSLHLGLVEVTIEYGAVSEHAVNLQKRFDIFMQ